MSEIPKKLRETWPIDESFGPVTAAQRQLANDAADLIEKLEGELLAYQLTAGVGARLGRSLF